MGSPRPYRRSTRRLTQPRDVWTSNAIFRLPLPYETPWLVSLLMIVGLVTVSGLVLEKRVRGVEIVS